MNLMNIVFIDFYVGIW